MKYQIILASGSPRRRQILENLGIPFKVIRSDADEYLDLENSPFEWVSTLSKRKAYAVLPKVKGPAIILGVDTVVADMGRILGKPKDKEEAMQMLRQLQGRRHNVYSGVTLLIVEEDGSLQEEIIVDSTEVSFNPISLDEIYAYLETGEYEDKAGAYGIQGKAGLFIDTLYGSYSTGVGLPVHWVFKVFKKNVISLWDYMK